ncbi:MAG: hypothetical protein ACYTA3_07710 [Planctomycetota bacterium]
MRSLSLSRKLIGLTRVGVIGTIALVAWIGVTTGPSALLDHETEALAAIRSARQHYLENTFRTIREPIFNFSRDRMISEAIEDFSDDISPVALKMVEERTV